MAALTDEWQDILGCQAALFEWAESYDTKDWDRLARCLAPTLRVRTSGTSITVLAA